MIDDDDLPPVDDGSDDGEPAPKVLSTYNLPFKQKGEGPRKRCSVCRELKYIVEFDKIDQKRADGNNGNTRKRICKACYADAKGVALEDVAEGYIVSCAHCGKKSPMTKSEVRRIVNEAVVTEERLDPDAPIKAIIAGALGEGGAQQLGASLRRKIMDKETPTTERMRCYELLINCMKHFENSQPAPADLSRLDRHELEVMLSRAMRGTINSGPVGPPAWMQPKQAETPALQVIVDTPD